MSDKKSHWEKVYNQSPLDVSWYQQRPSISLQLIKDTQLATDSAIIDIGGGTSVLIDHLANAGYTNLSVLDISPTALSYAQDRLSAKAKDVCWIEADITSFKTHQRYSLWHDRAVFHFLTDSKDRERYIDTLKLTLKANGHLIIAAFAINGPTQCSGLEIVQYNTEKITAELGRDFTLIKQLTEKHITPANHNQLFNYFYFRKIAP